MISWPWNKPAPDVEQQATSEWMRGRSAFLAGHRREAGSSWPYFLGYLEAMAEEVQRLRQSGLRKNDGSP